MPTTAPASSPSRFWSPRYWPTWLGLAIMWCLAHLPYRMQMRLGRLLGRALNAIGGRRRHIAAVNLRLCLPELSEHERAALLRRHLEAGGSAFIETAMSWFASTERLRPLADIRGLEHLHAALAKGRGAIVLMGHFTTMELIARLLALHAPLHVTYREHKNRLYQHTLERVHRAHCAAIIAHTDAPVIPVLAERLAGDQGYRITLQAPLADYPSGDLVADATRINRTIEAQARRIPEQYLWVHRRFKPRPDREKNVYDG